MMKFWTDELKESTAELAAASGELLPMERDIKRNEAKLRDFDPEKMKMPSKPEALPAWVPSCTVDDARRQIELRREHEARMERWKMAVEAQIKELDAWRALSMQTKELILLKLPTLKRRVRVSTDRIEEAEEAIKDLRENPWLIKERREALAEAPGVPEVAVGVRLLGVCSHPSPCGLGLHDGVNNIVHSSSVCSCAVENIVHTPSGHPCGR